MLSETKNSTFYLFLATTWCPVSCRVMPNGVSALLLRGNLDLSIWWKQIFAFILFLSSTLS